MPAEARVTPIWKKQKLFIALALLAFGGYFFWDGAVGYPRANARYAEWKSYEDSGRKEEWKTHAQAKGWKADEWQKWLDDPHQRGQVPAERWARGKIVEQFAWGGVMALLGLGALAYWLVQKDRMLRSDPEGVTTPAGRRVPFAAITGLGKKKWEEKGLATVRYEIEGRGGKFTLDDYKFDRDPTHQILAEIEAHLQAGSAAPRE